MTAFIALSPDVSGPHRTVFRETCEQVARNPYGHFPFHRGPDYARCYLGHPDAGLAARAGLREVHPVACYNCLRDAPIAEAGRGTPRGHGLTRFAVNGGAS